MSTGGVLVTGARGRLGTVLLAGLEGTVIPFDLPSHDALSLDDLTASMAGCRQVVHLAWDLATENFDNGGQDPRNVQMAENVLSAALVHGVERVLLASSVHAGGLGLRGSDPVTPYGRSKRAIEELGAAAARKGLDVVSIRFGGLNLERPSSRAERGLFLSHADYLSAVRCALNVPVVPGRSQVFTAVSRSRWRRLSVRNQVGWAPS